MFNIPENCVPIAGTSPVTTNGGVTCDYIKAGNFHKIYIVALLTQAVAHATGLDPVQSTVAAGSDAKALSESCRIWYGEDLDTSDVLEAQTAAKTLNVDEAAKDMMVIFEIIPEAHMDVNNGFDWLGCTIDDSSQATNFASVMYFGVPRYAEGTQITAIA